ncbi:calcitonin gene-related peptide type 1 receptor isoform X1 [Xyrichtys novacula]|uniref:Calcitonin gene-related peptide type 1 receptor isoform X1 n=1 Tax=Xyrichtys novacula TaxID=13765 RepID=A0AAV1F2R3_XYRNO|nr:calcitonin gene-related peptide type 1 receptor isoform X1 [Xyrichtys novacula]
MGMFGGKYSLTAHSEKRNMWRTLTLTLIIVLTLGAEVCLTDDEWSMTAMEKVLEKQQQQNVSDKTEVLGKSRRQILAAQFECYLKIIRDPPRREEGNYCNRTWDGWLCWVDAAPGTSEQMCPGYYIDFDPAQKVTKVCHSNGSWFHHPESKRIWSNYTQCTAHTKDRLKLAYSQYYLAMVGHGLSIVSLTISLIIFSYFKSLSCQRISLHKNTFLSFILNSIASIAWLSLYIDNRDIHVSNPVSCKILAVVVQYTTTSNCFWMLCQGIYLHTLIIVAVFVGEQQLFWYYILGWGFPFVPATVYAVARGLFYNDKCWISSHTSLVYIIHAPIQAALLVNFFFLLNIVRVLITKLKETHCTESTTYMKAVRATLILIPLLGIQYILFPCTPEGHINRAIYDFFISIVSHFQGLLVAILFCFCNSEAQTALKRKWVQWKSAWDKTGWGETPITNSHFSYHHNSSITETSRTNFSLELPAAAAFTKHETNNSVPKEQQRSSVTCGNWEVEKLDKLETSDI